MVDTKGGLGQPPLLEVSEDIPALSGGPGIALGLGIYELAALFLIAVIALKMSVLPMVQQLTGGEGPGATQWPFGSAASPSLPAATPASSVATPFAAPFSSPAAASVLASSSASAARSLTGVERNVTTTVTVVNIVLIGPGTVGREYLQQLANARDAHEARLRVRLDVLAVVDSHGGIMAGRDASPPPPVDNRATPPPVDNRATPPHVDNRASLPAATSPAAATHPAVLERLDAFQLDRVVAAKAPGGGGLAALNRTALSLRWAPGPRSLDRVLDTLRAHGVPPHSIVVVDCSAAATDDVGDALLRTRRAGGGVVLANKKPLASGQHVYDGLMTSDPRMRYGATVGAGLPVISTLRRMVTSGDQVVRVDGILSGTLGFIFSGMDAGKETFSAMVRKAAAMGFTEPDPRDDLNGMDVARKALIVVRELGWKRNLRDIEVQPLFPESMRALSTKEFMDKLPELDAQFEERRLRAHEQGACVRYVVSIGTTEASASVKTLPLDNTLCSTRGTENVVAMASRWFKEPVVVRGAGAGIAVTAAAALADTVEVAFAIGIPPLGLAAAPGA